MNLYLLTQTVNTDYDTYDVCVVAAATLAEAHRTHPGPYYVWAENVGWRWRDRSDLVTMRDTTWAPELRQIKVRLLGKAAPDVEAGVVCASFHAG